MMKPLPLKTQTSVILLAGGSGNRMQANLPKQYLLLGGKAIARYSFDLFLQMPEIDEIIVICNPEFRHFFSAPTAAKEICFALPGARRQDSVYNGLKACTPSATLICIHDSARPFIDRHLVNNVLAAGSTYGAATLGMPIKFTVKEADAQGFVKTTPDRTFIWEIQTPQVLKREIIEEGFRYALHHQLTVTDDTSLAELIGKQVKLVEGSHTNFKITVPIDLTIAQNLLKTQEPAPCHTILS